MARTANLSVSVTWGGAAAARGLQSFTQSLTTLSGVANIARKSMASMMPSNLFSANGIKGLADMKAGMEMIRGVFQSFVMAPVRLATNILQMGAEMESAGIRMGALMGNMNAGTDVMKALSRAAMATGVPFADMAKGMRSLIQSGMSPEAAAETIDKMMNTALLMGGGAEGFQSAIGAITELQQNAMAAEAPLKALQDAGVPVFEKLAETLSAMFGRAVGLDEAMQMVKQGAVLTATALDAVFKAGNADKVKAAGEALRDTVENQVRMASVGMEEVFRNIGASLLKAFDPGKALASFRGALDGILTLVQQISDTFLPIIDPKNRAQGMEDAFKFARDLTFTIAEQLSKAAITIKNVIIEASRAAHSNLIALKLAFMEFKQGGTKLFDLIGSVGIGGSAVSGTGLFFDSSKQQADVDKAREEFNKSFDLPAGGGNELKKVEDFFAAARAGAAAQDKAKLDAAAKAMADLAAAAKAAKPPLDANAKAVQAQAAAAKEAAAKVETMNKNVRDMASKMFTDFATPFEKFTEKMRMALAEVNQAAGPEKNRFQAAMRRRVGADIEAFLKEFGPKAAEPAAAQLAGSAGLIESDIRARMEADGKAQDVPALLKQAMDNAKNQADQQVKRLDELVNAAHKANMFKTIMALPKP